MLKNSKNKGILRSVGIVIVGSSVVLFWWFGWFNIIFYILGLYAAIYIVSYLFKTTSIIAVLISIGGFALYAISAIIGLYFLYFVLHTMFNGSFWFGLLLLILLGTLGRLLLFVPVAVGLVLGYPLLFMSEDIEKRFTSKNICDDNTEQKEIIEIDVTEKLD
ncbi:MAG: hypothetical protein ABIF22_02105 [bacterium]